MNAVVTILLTILIFGVIIFIHEFGHFITARMTGVTVNEFSLGMGPAILKKQGKKTLYSLRLLPIGGYCAMEGETEDSEDENSFRSKSVPKRILICAAGAAMNIILGFILMLVTLIGEPYYSSSTVAVFNSEDALSAQSGLMVGDTIKKVNHTTIFTANDIVFELLRDDDGIVSMEVVRDGQTVKLDGVQFKVSGEGNNKSLDLDFKVLAEDASFFGAIGQTWGSTVSLVRNTWVSIGDLITGHIGISELSGPVGVGEVVGQAAAIGWRSLVNIAAFISISIGIFNLLPFPALDGGRIVFLIIEAIRRKPINPKIENWVNTVGLILLFALMIVVTFKDVLGLF